MIFVYVSEKWGSKIAPIEPSDTTDECWGSNRPANGGFLDSQMGKAVYPIYTRWDNAPSDFTGMFAEELHAETTLLELLQHWRGPGIVTGDVHHMFITCSSNILQILTLTQRML